MKNIKRFLSLLIILGLLISCNNDSSESDKNDDTIYLNGLNGTNWFDGNSSSANKMTFQENKYVFIFKAQTSIPFPYGFKFTTANGWTEQIINGYSRPTSTGREEYLNNTNNYTLPVQGPINIIDRRNDDSTKFYLMNECIIGLPYTITLDLKNMLVNISGYDWGKTINYETNDNNEETKIENNLIYCESIWSSYGEVPLKWNSDNLSQRQNAYAVINCSAKNRFWGNDFAGILQFCIYDGSTWAIKYTGATDLSLGNPSRIFLGKMEDNICEIEEGKTYKIFIDATTLSVIVTEANDYEKPIEMKKSFILTLYSNDGYNTTKYYEVNENDSYPLPSNSFIRDGYEFLGWGTSRTGNKEFEDREIISMNSNLTLYAIWTPAAQDISDWEKVGNMPFGMNGHNVVVKDNKFIITIADIALISEDGKEWTEVNISNNDDLLQFHSSLVFNNKIYNIGGFHRDSKENDIVTNLVSYSNDGKKFVNIQNVDGIIDGSIHHAGFVFNDAMWIVGGETETESYHLITNNNIWKSSDGFSWEKMQSRGLSPRAGHKAITFKDKVYLIGGFKDGAKEGYDEILVSSDGYNWNVLTNDSWADRNDYTLVANSEGMWVIGGTNGEFLKDVWFSDDGKNWKCIDKNPPFAERAAHASAIKDGYLYIFGGCNGKWDNPNNLNDVWRKYIGIQKEELPIEFTLKLKNNSLYPINSIYIKESESTEWNENKIISALNVNCENEFVLKKGTYSIKITDTKGRTLEIDNFSVNSNTTKNIENKNWIEPVIVIPKYSITVTNNFKTPIKEIYIKEKNKSDWGKNLIDGNSIGVNSTHKIVVLNSGKDYDLKIVSSKTETVTTASSARHTRNRYFTSTIPVGSTRTVSIYYYPTVKLDNDKTITINGTTNWDDKNK